MDKYLWFAHGVQVAPTRILPVRMEPPFKRAVNPASIWKAPDINDDDTFKWKACRAVGGNYTEGL